MHVHVGHTATAFFSGCSPIFKHAQRPTCRGSDCKSHHQNISGEACVRGERWVNGEHKEFCVELQTLLSQFNPEFNLLLHIHFNMFLGH